MADRHCYIDVIRTGMSPFERQGSIATLPEVLNERGTRTLATAVIKDALANYKQSYKFLCKDMPEGLSDMQRFYFVAEQKNCIREMRYVEIFFSSEFFTVLSELSGRVPGGFSLKRYQHFLRSKYGDIKNLQLSASM